MSKKPSVNRLLIQVLKRSVYSMDTLEDLRCETGVLLNLLLAYRQHINKEAIETLIESLQQVYESLSGHRLIVFQPISQSMRANAGYDIRRHISILRGVAEKSRLRDNDHSVDIRRALGTFDSEYPEFGPNVEVSDPSSNSSTESAKEYNN